MEKRGTTAENAKAIRLSLVNAGLSTIRRPTTKYQIVKAIVNLMAMSFALTLLDYKRATLK